MASVAVLQHLAFEGRGVCEDFLAEAGHRVVAVPLHKGARLPRANEFDAWVVLGGLMSVNDTEQHPYLIPERDLLAGLIAEDRAVLGLCLGAQFIALAAGARVYPQRPKEIGFFRIALTDAAASDPLFRGWRREQEVFEWHGDTFDLPAGAVPLASSGLFGNQAFRLGQRVYGLQFHLEFTAEVVAFLRQACPDDVARFLSPANLARLDGHLKADLARQNALCRQVLSKWMGLFD